MSKNAYLQLKQKQQKEFNEFPMVFAFSDKQFEEGMRKLGLEPTDTDKVYKGFGGAIYRRSDAKKLHEMIARHDKEMKQAIESDKTGEGFIFQMFNYELGNHEYNYTRDTTQTLDALGFTLEEVNSDQKLAHGLRLACKKQLESEY